MKVISYLFHVEPKNNKISYAFNIRPNKNTLFYGNSSLPKFTDEAKNFSGFLKKKLIICTLPFKMHTIMSVVNFSEKKNNQKNMCTYPT